MNPPSAPAPVDPVVYHNPILDGRPGLHALIVGVSAYPNLPGPGDPTPEGGWPKNTLGLHRLESAAAGANELARWLIARGNELTPPLASVRLLLSPTTKESSAQGWWTHPAVLNPTLENLATAATAWRSAADGHSDSMTLFYFAGHGVQRDLADHVLLLHDFGRLGPTLASALATSELIDGMRLVAPRENLARRQLFFFDACRLPAEALKNLENPKTGLFWDVDTKDKDERQYAIFYATLPGYEAYGNVGGHSLFCEALLRCLSGGAAVPPAVSRSSQPLPWRVTARSLQTGLQHHLESVSAELGTNQSLGSATSGSDFQVRIFSVAPDIAVNIYISPEPAKQRARLILSTATREPVKHVDPPIEHTPHRLLIPVGSYFCEATDCGNPRQYADPEPFFIRAIPPPDDVSIEFVAARP